MIVREYMFNHTGHLQGYAHLEKGSGVSVTGHPAPYGAHPSRTCLHRPTCKLLVAVLCSPGAGQFLPTSHWVRH